MARIILAAVMAALVAFSAATMAQQSSRASRWQPEQFGPIVQTDTMWSIATYYGRQRGVSVYEMMDVIVAANPRAFRDNRPDFMLTGFYLEIPDIGTLAQTNNTPKAVVPTSPETAATKPAEATDLPPATDAGSGEEVSINTTQVESEIAISVSEMEALRGQLSESINLIESLQTENTDLQQRLEAVTKELTVLRQLAAEEQRASAEMESIAQEINSQGANELTAATVDEQPSESNPALDTTTAEEASAEQEPTTAVEQQDAVTTVTEQPAEDVKPAVTRSRNKQTSWLDWLLKPLHLGVIALLLVIVLGALWYFAYVRRLEREMAADQVADNTDESSSRTEADEDGKVAAVAQEQEQSIARDGHDLTAVDDTADEDATDELVRTTRGEIEDEEIDRTSEQFADESTAPSETDDLQEQAPEPMTEQGQDVEVTDVDLDAYLREQADDSAAARDDDEAHDDDDDPMSREVDALLAFEPSLDEDEKSDESVDPEEVSEYRVVEEPEGDEAEMDSFGGLRLDDDMTTTPVPAQEDTETEDTEAEDTEAEEKGNDDNKTIAEDDDYLSIESLMDEADTEASEEHEDPYDKEKINEALAGEDIEDVDYDLSTEAMLDESKSPAARLDLAQVYIDMGEVEDARSLLESIQGCDDEEAEQEAAALLKKLSEQGGR
ncbi:FimV/HubP family polar landmark protein [Pseudidiomarina sp. E22-M8]|uniref:FimV/HubP family polar landmark protein n=1 Tax=Pseudidiomarina sp. E22-M8 TaxID=3424768 RepID=UPI00403C03E5